VTDKPREWTDQEYAVTDKPREWADQEYLDGNNGRDLPDDALIAMENKSTPEKTIQDEEWGKERNLAEMDETVIPDARVIPAQDMVTPESPREKIEQTFVRLLSDIRKIPGLENIDLQGREWSQQEMVDMINKVNDARPNYQIDRAELTRLIETNRHEPQILKEFTLQDKKIKENEKFSIEILKENSMMDLIEKRETDDADAKRKQQLFDFARMFMNNEEAIQKEYAQHVIELRNQLKHVSLESVRELPKPDFYVLQDDGNRPQPDNVLVSLNDVKELERNTALIALEDNTIQEMSLTTLVALESNINERINDTKGLIGLTKEMEAREKQKEINEVPEMKERPKINSIEATEITSGPTKTKQKKKIIY